MNRVAQSIKSSPIQKALQHPCHYGVMIVGITALTYALARTTRYSWKFTLLPSTLIAIGLSELSRCGSPLLKGTEAAPLLNEEHPIHHQPKGYTRDQLVVSTMSQLNKVDCKFWNKFMESLPEELIILVFSFMDREACIAWGSTNRFFRNLVLRSRARADSLHAEIINLFTGPPRRGPLSRDYAWKSPLGQSENILAHMYGHNGIAYEFPKIIQIRSKQYCLMPYHESDHPPHLRLINCANGKQTILTDPETNKTIELDPSYTGCVDTVQFNKKQFVCFGVPGGVRIVRIENENYATLINTVPLVSLPKHVRLFQHTTGKLMVFAVDLVYKQLFERTFVLSEVESQTPIQGKLSLGDISSVAVSMQGSEPLLWMGTERGKLHGFAVARDQLKEQRTIFLPPEFHTPKHIRPLGTWGLAITAPNNRLLFIDLSTENNPLKIKSFGVDSARNSPLHSMQIVEVTQRSALVSALFAHLKSPHLRPHRRALTPKYCVRQLLVTRTSSEVRVHQIGMTAPDPDSEVGDFCATAIPLFSRRSPVSLLTHMANGSGMKGWQLRCYPQAPPPVDTNGPKIGQGLNQVPREEAIRIIFSYLKARDLYACSLVSKSLRMHVLSFFSSHRLQNLMIQLDEAAPTNKAWQAKGAYTKNASTHSPITIEIGGTTYFLMLTQEHNDPKLQLIHSLTGAKTTLALELPKQSPLSFDAYAQGDQALLAVAHTQPDKKRILSIYAIQNTGTVTLQKSIKREKFSAGGIRTSIGSSELGLVRFFQPKDGPLCVLFTEKSPNQPASIHCHTVKGNQCSAVSLLCPNTSVPDDGISAIGILNNSSAFLIGIGDGIIHKVDLDVKNFRLTDFWVNSTDAEISQITPIRSDYHQFAIVKTKSGNIEIYEVPSQRKYRHVSALKPIQFKQIPKAKEMRTLNLSPTATLVTITADSQVEDKKNQIYHYIIKQKKPRFCQRQDLFELHKIASSNPRKQEQYDAVIPHIDSVNKPLNLITLTSTKNDQWCLEKHPFSYFPPSQVNSPCHEQ